jgi:hypothetical protein
MTDVNQNLIQKEINRRLNSGNARYHSVEHLFFSSLLSKNIKIRIHKTWSLTLREESRLRIFRPKRGGEIGGSRKVCNEGLHNLYSSPNIIRMIKLRRIRRAGHVACMQVKKNMDRILMGKSDKTKSWQGG